MLYVLLGAVPFISVLICCKRIGLDHSLMNNLPVTGSDELIYYKISEGIARYGIPQGFFGYNESHAAVGTFSTWGPMPTFVMGAWAALFGWNDSSPLIFNVVFLGIAAILFCILTRASGLKMVSLILLICGVQYIPCYCMTAMPEVTCYAYVFILVALCHRLSTLQSEEKYDLKWALCFAFLMILSIIAFSTRPFYGIFILFPCYYAYKRWHNSFVHIFNILYAGLALGVYYFISTYMCAPYFHPLIDFSLVRSLFNRPSEAFVQLSQTLIEQTRMFYGFCRDVIVGDGFSYGGTGICCICVFLIVLLLLVFSLRSPAGSSGHTLLWAVLALYMIGVYVVGFTLIEGGAAYKHFIEVFITVALFIIAYSPDDRIGVIMGLLFILICLVKTPMGVYTIEDGYIDTINEHREIIADRISVDETTDDPYDNTIIWVYYDDGMETSWRELYSVPSGMGISLCLPDYLTDHIADLKSRYIYTQTDGTVYTTLMADGAKEIDSFDGITILQIR